MATSRYQYETSPRKLEPNNREQRNKKEKIHIVKDNPKQDAKISKAQKRKHRKVTSIVLLAFVLLLTISYRNAQINEQFNEMQNLKTELLNLQKENEQLEIAIENSMNLYNIEKIAKEKLGMQKLTNKQIQYVALPKKDYTESASEKIEKEKNQNWFEQFVNKIFNR